MKRIGLIAGSGQFPFIFSRAAKEKKLEVYAIAHTGETDPGLEDFVDAIKWVKLGQLKTLIKFLRDYGVTDAAMAGAITKTNMFGNVRPDLKALKVLATMNHTQDDGLLRAFACELEKEGITIHAATSLVPELLAKKGCWTKRRPSRSEMADVRFGWGIVKEIGRLDIGQTLVVRQGSVMAVEAIDGTDATVRRGGRLGRKKTVVVKASKPNQDLRFDMPAVGIKTIKTMCDVGATVLAVEANRTVVFDRKEMVVLADRHGIAIIATE
ncbi:MAG: UDP-2,3-diacylglucosamine diphosphatase LpxI [Deltaproteobacteria bacterium]|nr:UDP-2,3-diacylglucosamine diphosphatase LpxI [Deltaproteobacteria bacterium]MBW2602154.1 UDP-2,3-diacylglucosamine diphosphatase LpxI [Deltaproteobacteria bacterium]